MSTAAQPPSVSTLLRLFEPIRGDLTEVEEAFSRHIQSAVDVIPDIASYVKDGGGKRIRPAVLLMAARMAGGERDRAILHASVVEFIHTATLVHDDIIDEASTRRGRDAVHTRWGNHLTVLFGDFLYLKSMGLALTGDTLEIVRVLCDVTLRIVEGEIYQLTKRGVVDIGEDEHFDIVRRKTALLFAGSAKIGGMLGDTTREQQDALWDYGINIGMAFQVVDDLLDFTGEADVLGKPVGGDLREGKMTLPLIHLLREGPAQAGSLVREAVAAKSVTPGAWHEILSLLARSRSVEYAQRVAVDYVTRAKRALDVFPHSEARDALLYLPDYVVSRDR